MATTSSPCPTEEAPTTRGVFILFEGVDRAGKTTHARRVVARMVQEGTPVEFMAVPDRTTKIGAVIDQHLRGEITLPREAAHYLFAANRWELCTRILDLIEAGTTIVMDRYSFSGVAYSVAKGMSVVTAWATECGLPAPDVVIQLILSGHQQAARAGWGTECNDNVELQRRVRDAYRHFHERRHWAIVPSPTDPDAVAGNVWAVVQQTVARVRSSNAPLATLH